MMLLDVLLCLSALVPVLIRKEGVTMQDMMVALGVILGRQSCCEKKECEWNLLPSENHWGNFVVPWDFAPRHSCCREKTQQQTASKKLVETSRNAWVSWLALLSQEATYAVQRSWASASPRLRCQRYMTMLFPAPIWRNGKHEKVLYLFSRHGYSLCELD